MTWKRRSAWVGLGCAALLAMSTEAQATKIGAGGVLATGDLGGKPLGGLQASAYFGFPSVERLSIGADVSWFAIKGATALAIDPNIHFNLIQLPVLDVYPIAGFNLLYMHANVLGISATEIDPGLLLGAGAEAKAGPLRPYAEAKVAIQDHNYLALSAGLRVKF
jgi:hypothetical protein